MSDHFIRKLLIVVVTGTVLSTAVALVANEKASHLKASHFSGSTAKALEPISGSTAKALEPIALAANDKTSHPTDSQDTQDMKILLEECIEIPKTSQLPVGLVNKLITECDYFLSDTDQDGVYDDDDKCPDTQDDLEVDEWGCPPSRYEAQKVVKLPPMPTDILFTFNSATLTQQGQKMLDQVMKEVGGIHRIEHIEIVGHTDRTGTQEYNQALSEKRANSVAAYWTGKGVSAAKMTQRGEGEHSPVASNDTREGRAQNRRVEITITRLK